MLRALALIALMLASTLAGCATQTPKPDASMAYSQAIEALDMSSRSTQPEALALFRHFHATQMGAKHRTDLSDAALLDLFDKASELASYYSMRTLSELDPLGTEMERRSFFDPPRIALHHRLLSEDRRLEDARAFAARFPEVSLPALPEIETGELGIHPQDFPTELRAKEDGTMRRQAVTLKDFDVLVVFHPTCPFSRRSFAALAPDPDFSWLFQAKVKWIAPPDAYGTGAVRQWNREHGEAHLGIAFHTDEWTLLDSWQIPVFYFLREGEIVHQVTGWPHEGNQAALQQARQSLTR